MTSLAIAILLSVAVIGVVALTLPAPRTAAIRVENNKARKNVLTLKAK